MSGLEEQCTVRVIDEDPSFAGRNRLYEDAILHEHGCQDVGARVALEGLTPREHLVQDDAE